MLALLPKKDGRYQTTGIGPDCIDVFLKEIFGLETLELTSLIMVVLLTAMLMLNGNTVICCEDGVIVIIFIQTERQLMFKCVITFALSDTEQFHGQVMTLG